MPEKRILVVDDEIDFVESLAFMMRKEGYEVRVALNGHQALEILHDYTPHLVLMDVAMPSYSGLEVLTALRGIQRWRDLPVVLMSGGGQEPELSERNWLDFLAKPFELKYFLPKISKYLESVNARAV
jgi:CheY-like chemotaxis protein